MHQLGAYARKRQPILEENHFFKVAIAAVPDNPFGLKIQGAVQMKKLPRPRQLLLLSRPLSP